MTEQTATHTGDCDQTIVLRQALESLITPGVVEHAREARRAGAQNVQASVPVDAVIHAAKIIKAPSRS